MKRSIVRAGLLLVAALTGCASPAAGRADRALAASAVGAPHGVAGTSVEGRAIEYSVVGAGPRAILVIATIHGDEPAGTPLVERLERELRGRAELVDGLTCVLLPVANPDGLAAGTRANARGVDINRNFPAENHRVSATGDSSPLSEPEARAIAELVQRFRPERIASFHQPLGCVDFDGPAEAWAHELARTCDLPVRKLGGRPGSLGSWAGIDRGIEIVTLELPPNVERLGDDALWERYGALTLAIVGAGRAD
jgi:protein MpaA